MLMKSSNEINIDRSNNCQVNRKPTATSVSPTYTNKRPTKANTVLIKPSNAETNDIKREEQKINESIQPVNPFYTASISSFQSESLSSKYKFEITSETLKQLKQHQTNVERRSRGQLITRHASLNTKDKNTSNNSSFALVNSSIDLNQITMGTNLQQEFLAAPNISITEMTTKDFHDEYYDPSVNHQVFNTNLVTDNEKIFIDQSSQSVSNEKQIKKKLKSKTKISKRPKQTIATQITTTATTINNSIASPIDLNSTKLIISNKLDDNNIGKTSIIVDTSKARSNLEVVRMCIRELGWKECIGPIATESDIYWHSSSFHEGNVNFAFNIGRVNKFPGMNDLLRKVHLTRSLNNMRLLFPNDFDFYPKTWFLPEHSQKFKDDVRFIHQQEKKHNRPLTTFIVKPSDGSQGEGIYLIRDPSHCIVTNRPHVVQEYIDRPLLINGLKFDLRIYVLILNLYPLEIFLYDEGLVRFATVGYKAPSTENLHETFMHLTNYSLNKRSSSYKHTIDNNQTDGSKRKLSLVWTQLISMFGNEKIERIKTLIVEMINKTILAILPDLRVEYEFELPLGKRQNISCFQIIGFDIILTENLKPILLEVNANPSLRIDFDKENDNGKLTYQSSPIDEEIKKPLVLETLKLALPKKKLNTFVRHAQLQVNDELMAQRVEKVAQRRVDERSEKIKSARKTRFDLKLNPFFSRPSDSITKEFIRLQQEQQDQIPSQKVLITSPTQTNESFSPTINQTSSASLSPTNSDRKTQRFIKKTKKLVDSIDDDESGTPLASIEETNSSTPTNSYRTLSTTISKRPTIKSASSHQSAISENAMIGSIKRLKIIFPANFKIRYRHLFLIDKIAYIYIQLVIMLGHKTMTGGQFRSFANICGILSETITAPSIDILYYQILRKWQQFVLRTNSNGLTFAAFIEAVFLLSQRKFPNSQSLLESVRQLVNTCVHNLNQCLQAPSSPLIQQSNQYLLHRATRINSSANPSAMNNRSSIVALRSTLTATNRMPVTPASAPTPRSQNIIPSATAVTTTVANDGDKTKQSPTKNSAKSVFPLFFDVL